MTQLQTIHTVRRVLLGYKHFFFSKITGFSCVNVPVNHLQTNRVSNQTLFFSNNIKYLSSRNQWYHLQILFSESPTITIQLNYHYLHITPLRSEIVQVLHARTNTSNPLIRYVKSKTSEEVDSQHGLWASSTLKTSQNYSILSLFN